MHKLLLILALAIALTSCDDDTNENVIVDDDYYVEADVSGAYNMEYKSNWISIVDSIYNFKAFKIIGAKMTSGDEDYIISIKIEDWDSIIDTYDLANSASFFVDKPVGKEKFLRNSTGEITFDTSDPDTLKATFNFEAENESAEKVRVENGKIIYY